jgi:predicted metal-dependent hydrolase
LLTNSKDGVLVEKNFKTAEEALENERTSYLAPAVQQQPASSRRKKTKNK